MIKITFVLAVMNESGNITKIYDEIRKIVNPKKFECEFIFVCDPSSDETPIELEKLAESDKSVKVIFMATRAGQTECMRAGLENASGKAVITMDADFQDPPTEIANFLEKWEEGADIVHGRRVNRRGDGTVYRFVTASGYRFLSWMTNGRIRFNVGDFRLIDKRVLPIILEYRDPNPFWRGITAMRGLKESFVEYERPHRLLGKSKYSRRIGSPTIASRGMATFSIKPLEIVQSIGFIFGLIAIFALLSFLSLFLFFPDFPRGVPSLIFLTLVFFSIQFLANAIFATYLIVLVEQTRRRPNYMVVKKLNF